MYVIKLTHPDRLFTHIHTHTQVGNCSSGSRGNRRPGRRQLQHDSICQLGLRLSGGQGDHAEAEEHPLSAAGQQALPPHPPQQQAGPRGVLY